MKKILSIVSFVTIIFGCALVCLSTYYSEWRYDEIITSINKYAPADIDSLRNFVHSNSVSNTNEEFHALWRDRIAMAQRFLDYLEGRNLTPAPMECSTQTGTLIALLRQRGHNTRNIDIYESRTFRSHSFMDIWNAEAGRWETQDPMLNIHWQSLDGTRVSIADFAETPDQIEPCRGNECGWHLVSTKNLLPMLDMIAIREKNRRYTIYTSRAVLDGSYCAKISKNCRDGFFLAATSHALN